MSENNTGGSSPARPRRGLPRRPGENDTATGVGETQMQAAAADAGQSSAVPAAQSPATPSGRRGLPRPGEAVAAQSAPAAPAQQAGARRTGLSSNPAAGAAPASAGRRTGLAAAATPKAPAAPAAPGRRSGLTTAAPTVSTGPSETTQAAATASEPSNAPKPLWLKLTLGVLGILVVAAVLVLVARWLRTLEPVQEFLLTYPGESHLPENAPVGLPAWLGWQHFLNAFFIVLIIRTGWQVRTQQRPPATWVRNNEGLIKTKNPPKKISLTLWTHLALDVLWLLNGVIFVIVLFARGQWMRVVPTSWDVFPNALSALLQYVSLDWPVENGWVNYNSLQLLAYFTTIFIAAPLAALTGVRMSGAWPAKAEKLNRVYPMELARAIHFPVMLYFALFVVMHVFLVFSTGALRNLNHMYASQDTVSWTGFWIFFASLVVMAGAVFAARPLVVAPIAQLMGRVGR